jgi:hypothetical protein
MGRGERHMAIYFKNLKGSGHMGDLDIDDEIVTLILKKEGVRMLIRFKRPRNGSSGKPF